MLVTFREYAHSCEFLVGFWQAPSELAHNQRCKRKLIFAHRLAYCSRVAHFLNSPCGFLTCHERASPEQGIKENFNISERWAYRSRVAHFVKILYDCVAQRASWKTDWKQIAPGEQFLIKKRQCYTREFSAQIFYEFLDS